MNKFKLNFISANKKWIKIFLLIFILAGAVCALSMSLISASKNGTSGEEQNKKATNEKSDQTINLSQISGIENIYAVASQLSPSFVATTGGGLGQPTEALVEGGERVEVRAAILPHHTLIAQQLAAYWQQLVDSFPNPSVVVIIGAAHQNQGEGLIQTTSLDYQTEFGLVQTDDNIVAALEIDGVKTEEKNSFDNEHSIGTEIPFIAKLFPNTHIVPIIAKSNAGENEARALAELLKKNLPSDALVIFSLDFSHGLVSKQSDINDQQTIALMDSRDLIKIGLLNETFVDSPFVLQTYLLWLEINGWSDELVWRDNSGNITGNSNTSGTSYMIFFASVKKEPLVVTVVGDIMLSRNVGSKLKITSVDQAFAQAKDFFTGSDLAFANLESVLSTSTVQSPKEIRFAADPARIDVLQFLGLTHVSVTNNHIGDYGKSAWEESLINLQNGGVVPVGGYGNNGAPVFAEAAGKRIVFLAFDTTIWKMDTETLSGIISPFKNQADIILVSFHWGNEYQHKPTDQQVELAHAAIDAGASVVIGHHPHVLESVEKYHNGLVLYSLGNFVFDQIGDDENESLAIRLQWSGEEKTAELFPARIDNYFPRSATDDEKNITLNRLAGWSDESLAAEIKNGKITW